MIRISELNGRFRKDMELTISEKDQKWGGIKELKK